MARQLKIVVGITGGIAAYKALSVVRGFVRDGHHVTVVATESALEFVGRASLEALSRNPVVTGLYDDVAQVRHVALGQESDVIVVAPATANTLANMAGGHAPDLLGNILLAARGRVVVAPAMHTEMWEHPATQSNIALLRLRGIIVVGPASGALTGDDTGAGRMVEPDEIVAATYAAVTGPETRDLMGRRILISGGGTREALDPVRYIGNRSSGRQAVALAEAALSRGAIVTFVQAHMDVPVPTGATTLTAETADEMLTVMREQSPLHDVVVMAAAVADYRPAQVSDEKLKKSGDEPLILALEQTKDVLADISAVATRQNVIVGFAAETAAGKDLLSIARDKLTRKGCDLMVANTVSWDGGIGSSTNDATILRRHTTDTVTVRGDKLTVAHRILDELV